MLAAYRTAVNLGSARATCASGLLQLCSKSRWHCGHARSFAIEQGDGLSGAGWRCAHAVANEYASGEQAVAWYVGAQRRRQAAISSATDRARRAGSRAPLIVWSRDSGSRIEIVRVEASSSGKIAGSAFEKSTKSVASLRDQNARSWSSVLNRGIAFDFLVITDTAAFLASSCRGPRSRAPCRRVP